MTNTLETALAYTRRGWYVFPVQPNGKVPLKDFAWKERSTNDPAKVQAAGDHPLYRDCNWAVDCGRSGLVVVDVDVKKDKDGEATLKTLPPLPSTMEVRTPTGGRHLYFTGDGPTTAGKLGVGLDTRGVGGYVLIPGSKLANGTYTFTAYGDNPSPAPSWLVLKLGASTEKRADRADAVCELDQPHNIDRATQYLTQGAPEAIEGSGGDATTYEVACRVRDLGLSETKALELMSEHWNQAKASPPWDENELACKVHNAYQYSRDRAGNATPEAMFPQQVRSAGQNIARDFLRSAKDILSAPVKIEWAIPGYIERDTVTLWFSGYAQFKSFLALDLAVQKAIGGKWAGREIPKGCVWYLQGEGHGGTARRLKAILLKNGILEDIALLYFSASAISLSDSGCADRICRLKEQCPSPELIIIDTAAAHFGGGDENSTKDMTSFLNNVNAIRAQLGCAVLIIHHSGHGDKSRSRGASCLEAGVDAVYRISRDDMRVCLESPLKMKDGEPAPDTWFQAHVVTVGADEELKPVTSICLDYTPNFKSLKKLGSNQQFIFEQVKDVGTDRKSLQDVYAEWKGGDYKRQNFYRELKCLVDKKILNEEKGVIRKCL